MVREHELRFLANTLIAGECVSVTGMSNMGKSSLMRDLGEPAVRKHFMRDNAWTYVYVDCNLMPERSEQALHELTLRSLIETLRSTEQPTKQHSVGLANANGELIHQLSDLHQQVVQPAAPIRSPLAFGDAINLVCEPPGRVLTLAFDEFDDPFEKLTGRAFLNLRALKDKFAHTLTYLTATERPLPEIRNDGEASEFAELFADRVQWVGLLNYTDASKVVMDLARGDADQLHPNEIEFVVGQAGGHPALLGAVVNIWRRIACGVPENSRQQALSLVKQAIDSDATVRSECVKLWAQLSEPEQQALALALDERKVESDLLKRLRDKRLLPVAADHDNAVVAGEILHNFARRQILSQQNQNLGIRVDIDAGEVIVDGHMVEALTELEYKLLLLLYGRLNKIVDKYTIVANVWGENYLDSVDDARIEKLVSRLRGKLEPAADEPRYLITLRGRGYKLVG
jgi:DNA-binding winged helix-turn-helix (wHTH) protein